MTWTVHDGPFQMMHLVRDKIHSWFDLLQSFWKAWKVFLNHFESLQHSSIQFRKFLRFIGHESFKLTSVLVTDVGDEMCWWQLYDVGDGFSHFDHQNPLSFYIGIGWFGPTFKRYRQHGNSVTNIYKLSPTLSHQHHCHLIYKYDNI